MIVIGIDPGYDRIGIAIVERKNEQKETLLYSECFLTSSKEEIYDRLTSVGKRVKKILKKYNPDYMAIEKLFITKNQKTAMHVSEARGIIIYEAKLKGLSIFEYSPPQIKMAVTGHGGSDKTQVIKMIPLLVNISKKVELKKAQDDEYDAIAVALTCIASERKMQ